MCGAKYDVLVCIYNPYAGILKEFLSNQDPVKCLMLDDALNRSNCICPIWSSLKSDSSLFLYDALQ